MTRPNKLFLVLLLSCCSFLQCFSQDVTFNTQAEVDAFDSSITTINGDLTIYSTSTIDPIVDLSNLLNLVSIDGELAVSYNDDLPNLDDLSNLTSIGGDLRIWYNDALANLDGLSNLISIEGGVGIWENSILTNIDGLSNISSINGDLAINDNNGLLNLDGLSNLISIGEDLAIRDNSILTNIDGLSNLTSIGGYCLIRDNSALVNIDGLSSLVTIGDYLGIENNDELINVDGLSGLTSLVEYMEILHNDALTNLNGLSNLTSISGYLEIQNNDALISLNDLSSLSSIGEYFWIQDNDALTNLNGLSSLTSIGRYLRIHSNNVLNNIDGLSNLISIGRFLWVENNNALINVDGLSNLTIIGEYLQIRNNDALINIDGLISLTSVGLSFYLDNNASLVQCCGIHELLSTPNGIDGSISISNNPSKCSSVEEVISAPCPRMNISINVPCVGAENGSIQAQILLGIAPFTYTWQRIEDGQTTNGSSNEPNIIVENLMAGTYNLAITDAIGNEFIRENIVLVPIPGSVFEIIEITTTNSSNGLSNGAIHLTVAGGFAPYNLSWSGTSPGMQMGIVDPVFTIPLLMQGEYEITVSDDVGNQQTIAITLLDETVPVFPCTQPLDIVILNDVSGSVDAVEYDESKQFFVDFLNAVNIGTALDESRAAIIEWSSSSDQYIQIPITGNLSTLQDYVNYDRSYEGGTNPLDALNFGENYLASIARPDVEQVLILSTDGTGGQISPSLVALADQYKADGYHIITIAFDGAFIDYITRNILRQVASIDALAPGAPAYSLLDQDLAENIVNLYLCPIDPGSSATAYFNRDGTIEISEIEANGGCPNPDNVTVTFTIDALQELSIPPGTPVTFYYNDPALFGATPILTWLVPCAIPAGTSETYTATLPVTGAANIFAVLNDDNNQGPPISFPITDLEELAWSNNISDGVVCVDPLPTLQVLKYTTTPTPICNNTVIYTVDVCNIADLDATGVIVADDAPDGFVLLNSVVNNNGCSIDNNGSYDIPANCCVSITYTYNATNAAEGSYNDQDVYLSGDINQVYLDFDGATTSQEDVMIDGTIDCPSTVITFTKEVNATDLCEDAFVAYTFTIDNQLNVPLQGLSMTDALPAPVTWVFQPYSQNGLSISNSTFVDGNATFIIDEVAANTIASFSMDAILGDWVADGVLTNSATLENVPDLENGGIQTLISNTVTTNISAEPEIEVSQIFNCNDNTLELSAVMNGQSSTAWAWVTTGDGSFSDVNTASTIYTLGIEEITNGETILSVEGITACGEINKTVEVVLEAPEPNPVTLETCEGETIEYEGTILSIGDSQDFTLQNSVGCDSIVSVTVVGVSVLTESLTFEICDGETIDYEGTILSVGDSQDFTFPSSMGCDSIVTVTVSGIAPIAESMTLEACEGETIDYEGITLSIGDSQDFSFPSSLGCDSIVSVTVVGIAPIAEYLTLETCDGEVIDYNGTILSAGDSQEFIFLSNTGCDSIVTVTVVGAETYEEDLTLQTCEDETIEYNGTILSGGDSQSFTFQSSVGCDSIVTVTVETLAVVTEELDLETCYGVPVIYNGLPLSVGEEHTFVFENNVGCDSIITVNVNSKEGGGKIGLPNTFSPNDDSINDCFEPFFGSNFVTQEYELQVFNRWGGLVFYTNDPFACWDGMLNDQPVVSNVYVWMMTFTTDGCEERVLSGDVLLVR